MRKLVPICVVALALAVFIAVLIAGVSPATSTQKASGLTIYPASSVLKRSDNSGAVMFYVSNAEPLLVHLARLEVQAAATNGWKTISTETSPILNPGAPSYQWAGGLLAGSQRTFYVKPPPEGRWRVRLTYLRQEHGVDSLLVTCTFAWCLVYLVQAFLGGPRKCVPLSGPAPGGEPRVFAVAARPCTRTRGDAGISLKSPGSNPAMASVATVSQTSFVLLRCDPSSKKYILAHRDLCGLRAGRAASRSAISRFPKSALHSVPSPCLVTQITPRATAWPCFA